MKLLRINIAIALFGSGAALLMLASQVFHFDTTISPTVNYAKTVSVPNPHAQWLYIIGGLNILSAVIVAVDTIVPDGVELGGGSQAIKGLEEEDDSEEESDSEEEDGKVLDELLSIG